jgi:hypothetical protein
MRTERLGDGYVWLRVADPAWRDPLDPSYAARLGQRWNPPESFPVLYLNEDLVTARINMRRFLDGLPYGPEDLRDDTAPVLVEVVLPRDQVVADIHTPVGVAAVGLPAGYPLGAGRRVISHARCQPIGLAARNAGLRGIRCRSAQAPFGAGRELAWFPATSRSRAQAVATRPWSDWFWA